MVVFGVWQALAGAIALLAGVAARPGRPQFRCPGERVMVWYDPADPGDVLVYGSDGRWSDRALPAVGLVLLVIGVVLAVALG